MATIAAILTAGSTTREVSDASSIALLRRVVEGLPRMRPGRHSLYLGRPDPAAVRAEGAELASLLATARRSVVVTPPTALLPVGADRRDPGLGWLSHLWFTAVLGEETAMALVANESPETADRAWFLTDPTAVRRLISAVEGELARPDPELLAV